MFMFYFLVHVSVVQAALLCIVSNIKGKSGAFSFWSSATLAEISLVFLTFLAKRLFPEEIIVPSNFHVVMLCLIALSSVAYLATELKERAPKP